MKELEPQQWGDFKGRFQNYYCPLCNRQSLMFSEPKYGSIGDMDVIAVTCANCAHVVLFDIAEVSNIAKEIDKEYRDNKWR